MRYPIPRAAHTDPHEIIMPRSKIHNVSLAIALLMGSTFYSIARTDPIGPSAEETLDEFIEDAWTGRLLPADERRFIEICQSAQKGAKAGKDERRLRSARSDALTEGFKSTRFEHWVGILDHATDDGGDGYIMIATTLAPGITLKTDLNIKPGSLIQKAVATLPYGTTIEISGDFARDGKGKDYFMEGSFTDGGSLKDPEWKVVIDGVKPLE